MQIVYVGSDELLNTAVNAMVAETTYLAIDTEFRREDTYFPQLCLIQVATQDNVFLIDALAIQDLSPFFKVLIQPNLLKVFHSGRQDLEIFCHLMQGQVATPVFDTQIAAMLTGYGESAGFESLASKLLNVSLDKSSRHTDWTQRPLAEKQKTYAVNDVLYLRPLYDIMVQKLIQKERLSWMVEEVIPLETPEFLITEPKQAWRKLSITHPSQRYLALIQRLTEWREDTAQRTDTPRSWLLKDEAILELAVRKPITIDTLRRISYFPVDDLLIVQEVIDIVQNVLNIPDDELPALEALPILSKSQQTILEMMKVLLKIVAEQLDVNSKLIAEKEDLVRWLAKDVTWHAKGASQGWRYKIFWNKAQDLLDGKLALRVQKNHVVIEATNFS